MSNYNEITTLEARQLITEKNPIILDTRDAHSYKEGHIDGAMHSHDGLVEGLIKKRNTSQHVIIYCYHGNASKDLADLFGNFGFKNVHSLMGGYVAWKKTESELNSAMI